MNKEFPNFLKDLLLKDYGEEITEKIIKGYTANRKVTLRINLLKTNAEKIKQELEKAEIKYKEVEWSKEALILENVIEDQIRNLDIYKKRRNLFAKPILNATTNNFNSKIGRNYSRHDSSSRR